MFAETLEENMVEERWAPGPSNSPSQGQGLQNPDPLDSYMGDGQPSTTFEDAMGLGGSESDFCSESTLFDADWMRTTVDAQVNPVNVNNRQAGNASPGHPFEPFPLYEDTDAFLADQVNQVDNIDPRQISQQQSWAAGNLQSRPHIPSAALNDGDVQMADRLQHTKSAAIASAAAKKIKNSSTRRRSPIPGDSITDAGSAPPIAGSSQASDLGPHSSAANPQVLATSPHGHTGIAHVPGTPARVMTAAQVSNVARATSAGLRGARRVYPTPLQQRTLGQSFGNASNGGPSGYQRASRVLFLRQQLAQQQADQLAQHHADQLAHQLAHQRSQQQAQHRQLLQAYFYSQQPQIQPYQVPQQGSYGQQYIQPHQSHGQEVMAMPQASSSVNSSVPGQAQQQHVQHKRSHDDAAGDNSEEGQDDAEVEEEDADGEVDGVEPDQASPPKRQRTTHAASPLNSVRGANHPVPTVPTSAMVNAMEPRGSPSHSSAVVPAHLSVNHTTPVMNPGEQLQVPAQPDSTKYYAPYPAAAASGAAGYYLAGEQTGGPSTQVLATNADEAGMAAPVRDSPYLAFMRQAFESVDIPFTTDPNAKEDAAKAAEGAEAGPSQTKGGQDKMKAAAEKRKATTTKPDPKGKKKATKEDLEDPQNEHEEADQ
ncbi:hypothetical protein B0T11DRAFT_292364 [Plectosphaerella cucumerina]|uniref:Uncharacterized protein n=1 Tax=Plectosphaerella cucumerina TaxID=40658 RepID=A0A8K0TNN4_9PEZI|nr:hypothetical protein B0T11DRAFT_292364 [Plectosphaerella cucumerina]